MKESNARLIEGTNKRIFEERVDYVLHRPHNYIGAIDEHEKKMFVYSGEKIEIKSIKLIPGFIKIINEIIDNSTDEGIRTNFEFSNKIDFQFNGNSFIVEDNGRGIEVLQDSVTGKYVPEILFSHLESGENFDLFFN